MLPTPKNWGAKTLAPLAVLGMGLIATIGLIQVEPSRESTAVQPRLPLVPVVTAEPAPSRLQIHAQGTVEPRIETDLVLEVGGRIEWTAPEFETGGRFSKDEVLLRIDPRDYEVTLERARAAEERAASQAELARAGLGRKRSLRDQGATSAAHLDEAESSARVAAANLREARAAREQAELDLARTEVRAPFDGRVRQRHLSAGQFAARGTSAARIFDTRSAEVRLTIPSHELGFLELGLGASPAEVVHPPVVLTGRFAGRTHTWHGEIVRTEGALDPKTRMLAAVARVDAGHAAHSAPLPIGLFVDATIEGRTLEPAVALPRGALRGDDQVLVVGSDERVEVRSVQVLRTEGDRAWIGRGVEAGEQVIVQVQGLLTEGMQVRVQTARAEPSSAAANDPGSSREETAGVAP